MKRIRLDAEAYEEGAAFSVTIATADRRALFASSHVAEFCIEQLRSTAAHYSASVYAYCFMPDHLHLLVAVPPSTSLVTFIRHFKQLSAYGVRRLEGVEHANLWQRRSYDHALRKSGELENVANYIWANPVRAGLVADIEDYPHWGSLVWDLSGSKDPDLRGRDPPKITQTVGAGLQTRAQAYR